MPPAAPRQQPTKVRPRRARGSLSREEILTAAYQLVEQDGLDALSMPALGRQVKAGVTSIYWYFRNKEELLIALAEQVTADVYHRWPPLGDGPWDEELRTSFTTFRDELRRVPVYLELFSLRPRFTLVQPGIYPVVMRHLEADATMLVKAGLSPLEASRVYTACSVYVRGFETLARGEKSEPDEVDQELHASIVETVEHLDAKAFPVLTLLGDIESMTVLDDDSFRRGLDLIIGGIRSEVESRSAKDRTLSAKRRS